MKTKSASRLCILSLCIGSALSAAEIRGWRDDGAGRFPTANVVRDWGDEAHVVWKTETPEWSNASPVIAGDRIFICAEPDTLLCLDRNTGEILWQRSNSYVDIVPDDRKEAVEKKMEQAAQWQRELRGIDRELRQLRRTAKNKPDDAAAQTAVSEQEQKKREVEARLEKVAEYRLPRRHNATGYSAPTPVTDGRNVYVFFGTGVAVAYDFDGNRLWARQVETSTLGDGHSASPTLAAGRFIIHVQNVHGLDAATGETVWTVDSRSRHGASVTAEIDGQPVVITANGEIIRAEDGKLLASGLHRLAYCAPLVHDGVVYFIEHGGKAFRLPAKADGTEAPEELWQTRPHRDRYYASPLYHDGHLYAVTRRGRYSVIDASNGDVLKSETLGSLQRQTYTSPTLAGSLIFLGAEGGSAVFMEPGADGKEVAASTLPDRYRTTPVFENNRAYVRTQDALYCLGK